MNCLGILETFTTHPQARVLADLFAEACRDTNPSAAIARLWAVLEALAERMPGPKKHEKVTQAISHLGIKLPMIGATSLIQRTCDIRNNLMHEGRIDDSGEASGLKAQLVDLVSFALRRSGFQEVEPTATYEP